MSSIPATPPPTTPPPTKAGSGAPPPNQNGYGSHSNGSGSSKGGETPSDFGHRNPDFDGDGKISDAEARVYNAETRSADSRYSTDSRERVSFMKEEAKNYRAEVTAHTEHVKSQNDNKMHKMFGFSLTPEPPPMPEKPF